MKLMTIIFLSAVPSPFFSPNILFTALLSHTFISLLVVCESSLLTPTEV